MNAGLTDASESDDVLERLGLQWIFDFRPFVGGIIGLPMKPGADCIIAAEYFCSLADVFVSYDSLKALGIIMNHAR